jgi:hypothetical protein
MQRKYRDVSGTVFGIVAVLHGLRALNQWPVYVAAFQVLVWASSVALLVAGSLCVWARCSRDGGTPGSFHSPSRGDKKR